MSNNEMEDPRPVGDVIKDQPEEEEATVMTQKPRQWLMDRSNGESKVDQERLGRPFCPMCWPPPCVKYAPDTLEQNACCEGFGSLGAFPEDHECSRIWLMRKSMIVHFCGLILSILSCLAITSDPTMLQNFSYSSGSVTGSVGETELQQVEFSVGLTTIYVKDAYSGARTYGLDELCTGQNLGIPLTSLADCQTCSDASSALIFSVLMGVITYLPTIASNVNRAYYNYDVNCQKVFGSLVALFNMVMSLYAWQGYANSCFDSFFDGDVTIPVLVPKGMDFENSSWERNETLFSQFDAASFFQDGATMEDLTVEDFFPNVNLTLLNETETRLARVNFDWSPGLGLILLVVATFLKIIDIINHLLIKTPSITRDLKEQLEYEEKYGSGVDKTEEEIEAGKLDEDPK